MQWPAWSAFSLTQGMICFPGGGFHHCSSDRGGGFCAYADITLAIKVRVVLIFFKIVWNRYTVLYCTAKEKKTHDVMCSEMSDVSEISYWLERFPKEHNGRLGMDGIKMQLKT